DVAVPPEDLVCDIPSDLAVMAEPALLASALRNIFANAIEYRSGSNPVRCAASPYEGGWMLEVENDADGLTPEDLPNLFDPFWRKDGARTDGVHVGLGLALVRAYCRLMEVKVTAEIPQPSIFRLSLEFTVPAAASTDPPATADALLQRS